jgi:D-alanine-D-alanine ligase
VQTSLANNQNIQHNIKLVFERLGFCVVTRIDGFLTPNDRVLLHDPNTLPGMSPASLIFKQMAEIGLNVSQSITYFIRQSIRERIRTGKGTVQLRTLLADLDSRIAERVAIVLPEQTLVFEPNDESFALARRAFSKLNAAGEVQAVPMLKVNDKESRGVPLNLMFKDRIEDLLDGLDKPKHPLIISTIAKAKGIIERFGGRI